MSTARKIALVVGIILVVLIATLAAIPLFFGDRITSRIKAEIDQSVNAKVAWSGAGLSLLRDFPSVSVTVNGLSVAGIRRFDRDTLLTMERTKLVLDLGSVIGFLRSGKPIVIRELSFDRPVVRARKLADGAANWDITKPQPPSKSSSNQAVHVSLKQLRITDGIVTLDDQQGHLAATVKGLRED